MPRHTDEELADVGHGIMAAVDAAIDRMVAKERGELRDGRYDDRRTTGFVIRSETTYQAKGSKPAYTDVSWWYGDEGDRYWNAWGSDLDYSVAWFDTKVKAKLAQRRCGLLSRTRIQPVQDAKRERADQLDRAAANLLARAAFLRGESQ